MASRRRRRGHDRYRFYEGRPPTADEAKAAVDKEDADAEKTDLRTRRRQRLLDEGWAGWEPDLEKRERIIEEYLRRCHCAWDHPDDCMCGPCLRRREAGTKRPRRCTCNIQPWASAPAALHEQLSPKEHGIEKTSDKKSGRKRKKPKKQLGPVPALYRRYRRTPEAR